MSTSKLGKGADLHENANSGENPDTTDREEKNEDYASPLPIFHLPSMPYSSTCTALGTPPPLGPREEEKKEEVPRPRRHPMNATRSISQEQRSTKPHHGVGGVDHKKPGNKRPGSRQPPRSNRGRDHLQVSRAVANFQAQSQTGFLPHSAQEMKNNDIYVPSNASEENEEPEPIRVPFDNHESRKITYDLDEQMYRYYATTTPTLGRHLAHSLTMGWVSLLAPRVQTVDLPRAIFDQVVASMVPVEAEDSNWLTLCQCRTIEVLKNVNIPIEEHTRLCLFLPLAVFYHWRNELLRLRKAQTTCHSLNYFERAEIAAPMQQTYYHFALRGIKYTSMALVPVGLLAGVARIMANRRRG